MNIDVNILIQEVEKRAALYDTTSPYYNDRAWKKVLWDKVCKALDNKFDTYDSKTKAVFGKEIQKRWQSLRDCFRRELVYQKTYQAEGGKKKGKYKYFDALAFLTPFTKLSNIEISSESETFQDTQGSERSHSPPSYMDTSLVEEEEIANNGENSIHAPKRYLEFSEENVMETVIPKKPKQEHTNNTDDVAFLMSLLPTFNDLTMQEKILLRIELMQTIMRFRLSRKIDDPIDSVRRNVVGQHLTLASTSTENYEFLPQNVKDEPTD